MEMDLNEVVFWLEQQGEFDQAVAEAVKKGA